MTSLFGMVQAMYKGIKCAVIDAGGKTRKDSKCQGFSLCLSLVGLRLKKEALGYGAGLFR